MSNENLEFGIKLQEDLVSLKQSYDLLTRDMDRMNNFQKNVFSTFMYILVKFKVKMDFSMHYYDLEKIFDTIESSLMGKEDFYSKIEAKELEEDDFIERLLELGILETVFVGEAGGESVDDFSVIASDYFKKAVEGTEEGDNRVVSTEIIIEDNGEIDLEIYKVDGKKSLVKNGFNLATSYAYFKFKNEKDEAKRIFDYMLVNNNLNTFMSLMEEFNNIKEEILETIGGGE